MYKECLVNNNIKVKLEEIEDYHEEFVWKHATIKEDYHDYEWVIKIYVERIDPFIYDEYKIFSLYNGKIWLELG